VAQSINAAFAVVYEVFRSRRCKRRYQSNPVHMRVYTSLWRNTVSSTSRVGEVYFGVLLLGISHERKYNYRPHWGLALRPYADTAIKHLALMVRAFDSKCLQVCNRHIALVAILRPPRDPRSIQIEAGRLVALP
jgi:hypothetical protein